MSQSMIFFTIGVYHSPEDQFFGKLKVQRIDTFCDLRQRRADVDESAVTHAFGRRADRGVAEGLRGHET